MRNLVVIPITWIAALIGGSAEATTTCKVEPSNIRVVLTESAPSTLLLERGDIARCDRDGFEPLDIAAEADAVYPVRMIQSRNVELQFPEEERFRVVVEWFSWSEASATKVATRVFPRPTQGILAVPVALEEPRFLRIHRENQAPVTILVDDQELISIAPAKPGGEVVVHFAPQPFLPVAVRLKQEDARQEIRQKTEGRWALIHPVAPGKYEITPLFRGGIKGDSQYVIVTDEMTTMIFPWSLTASGGVAATINAEVCTTSGHLRFKHLASGAEFLIEEWAAPCLYVAEGLLPGGYEVRYEGESLIEAKVTVPPRGYVRFNVDPDDVVVQGKVRREPNRSGALVVEFTLVEDGRTFTVESDPDGGFARSLPQPGVYTVGVRSSAYHSVPQGQHEFVRGLNELTIQIPGTALHVALNGVREQHVAMLWITGPLALAAPVSRDDFADTEIVGLPLGDYTIRARAADLITPAPSRFSLSEANPVAFVTLTLDSTGGTLRVSDPLGLPTPADVQAGFALPSSSPGSYSLKGVSAQSMITIKHPEFLPVCRHRGSEPDLVVALQVPAATTTRVRIKPPVERIAGYVRGLPGSTCSVDVRSLPLRSVHTSEYETTFEIIGLPPGPYEFGIQRVVSAMVPGPDVVIDWVGESEP